MKGTARTVTHAEKQSIVRSASNAAYVLTSDYGEVRTTVTACGYQHEAAVLRESASHCAAVRDHSACPQK